MTISPSPALFDDRIAETLRACADAARPITLDNFRTKLAVDNKLEAGFDPVTAADRDAETAIREIISQRFPDHGIVGEEWAEVTSEGPYSWIIDPIDGTRAFIAGIPLWGTLVGLTENGRAIAGLMDQPFTAERWLSVGGNLTYTRHGTEQKPTTSSTGDIELARLSTTAPEMFDGPHQSAWTALRDKVQVVRYGLDCYAYCLLASGHLDLVVEVGLKPVDIAPLIPIIEAAGGVVTTWDGGPAEGGGSCVAAATENLHAKAIEILRDAMLE